MKKLLALLVVLVMMMTSMQMVAFAADESESEAAPEPEAISEPVETDETVAADDTVEPENPETGSSAAPIAMASLAVLSLAGAVLTMRKK